MAAKETNANNIISYVGGRRPLYVEVMEELERLIKGRKLQPGEKLPSVESLTEILGVSRSTVREALANLETQGLIIRKQGSGTFVSHSSGKGFIGGMERIEPFRMIAKRAGLESEVIFREVSTVVPETEMTELLDIESDSRLFKVEIVEAINGVPTMYLVDYLKESCGDERELSEWDGSALTYLVEECDPPLSQSRTEIFAVGADEMVASKLKIPDGTPIQYQVDTYYSSSGESMGIGYLYILTDHFHFFVNRRVV
jgi:DNA-binding GntR family transcriptional regulator